MFARCFRSLVEGQTGYVRGWIRLVRREGLVGLLGLSGRVSGSARSLLRILSSIQTQQAQRDVAVTKTALAEAFPPLYCWSFINCQSFASSGSRVYQLRVRRGCWEVNSTRSDACIGSKWSRLKMLNTNLRGIEVRESRRMLSCGCNTKGGGK